MSAEFPEDFESTPSRPAHTPSSRDLLLLASAAVIASVTFALVGYATHDQNGNPAHQPLPPGVTVSPTSDYTNSPPNNRRN